MGSIEPEKFYRVKEVAWILGVSCDTIRRRFRTRPKVLKISGDGGSNGRKRKKRHETLLISGEAILNWMSQSEASQAA